MKDLSKRFINIHNTLDPLGQTQLQVQSKLGNVVDQGQMYYQYNYGLHHGNLPSTLAQQIVQQQRLPQIQSLDTNQLGGVQAQKMSGKFGNSLHKIVF